MTKLMNSTRINFPLGLQSDYVGNLEVHIIPQPTSLTHPSPNLHPVLFVCVCQWVRNLSLFGEEILRSLVRVTFRLKICSRIANVPIRCLPSCSRPFPHSASVLLDRTQKQQRNSKRIIFLFAAKQNFLKFVENNCAGNKRRLGISLQSSSDRLCFVWHKTEPQIWNLRC